MLSCALYGSSLSVGSPDLDLLLECGVWAQRYGVDITSSTGIIHWLMELYGKGVITAKDTDGIPMERGSREAIIGIFRKIVHREGFGDVLADGILPAAERIGRGARDYANQMKGLTLGSASAPNSLIPAKGAALCTVMSSRGDVMRGRTAGLEEGGEAEWVSLLYRDERKDERGATEYIEAVKQNLKI